MPNSKNTPQFEEIYLEPDEEVTSAVDKIKKSKRAMVALSLPRNSVLGQSIVNLKLLMKQAYTDGKHIALVSPDKVTRNLAERLGFATFDSVSKIDVQAIEAAEANSPHPARKPGRAEESAVQPRVAKEQPAGVPAVKEVDKPAPTGFRTQRIEASEPEESSTDSPENIESVEREAGEVESPAAVSDPAEAEQSQSAVHDYKSPGVTSAKERHMIPSRGNLRFYRKQSRKSLLIPIAIFVAVLLVGGAALAIALPHATVTAYVAAQPFEDTVTSTVAIDATEVNADEAKMPGKLVEVTHETKLSAKATGKKDMGEKATGTVTIFNEWDSLSHTLAAGTKVRSKSGNEYVLTEDVVVPGASSSVSAGKSVIAAGQVTAKVQASAAGDGYNIAATTFTIPSLPKAQQEKIYATSSATFTGGTTNIVTVVTQSDIDTLTENTKKKNSEEAVSKVKESAGDQIVLDQALQVVSQQATPSVAADTAGDALEVTVIGSYKAITFSTEDHKQLVEQLLGNKIPQGQELAQSGEDVAIDTSQIELSLVADDKLELTTQLKAFTVANFNKDLVQRSLIGNAPSSAEEVIKKQIPSLERVETSVTPSWWPRLPFLSKNLKVDYQYKAKSQ